MPQYHHARRATAGERVQDRVNCKVHSGVCLPVERAVNHTRNMATVGKANVPVALMHHLSRRRLRLALASKIPRLVISRPSVIDPAIPLGLQVLPTADSVWIRPRLRRLWHCSSPFDFEPKAHWDLGPELGILRFCPGR